MNNVLDLDETELMDISKEQMPIIALEDRLNDLEDIYRELESHGTVNRLMAVNMEQISPGILGPRYPVNSFTDHMSLTNFQVARISIEEGGGNLIIEMIKAIGRLFASIFEWIIGLFRRDTKVEQKVEEAKKEIAENSPKIQKAEETMDHATANLVEPIGEVKNKAVAKKLLQVIHFEDREKLDTDERFLNEAIEGLGKLTGRQLVDVYMKASHAQSVQGLDKKYSVLIEQMYEKGPAVQAMNLLAMELPDRLQGLEISINGYAKMLESSSRGDLKIHAASTPIFNVQSKAMNDAAHLLGVKVVDTAPEKTMNDIRKAVSFAASSTETKKKNFTVHDFDPRRHQMHTEFVSLNREHVVAKMEEIKAIAARFDKIAEKVNTKNDKVREYARANAKAVREQVAVLGHVVAMLFLGAKKAMDFLDTVKAAQEHHKQRIKFLKTVINGFALNEEVAKMLAHVDDHLK